MSQERLTLRKIREILRLKEEADLSNWAIARALKISKSTVGEYLRRAAAARLSWPLPEGISEEEWLISRSSPKDGRISRFQIMSGEIKRTWSRNCLGPWGF